MKIRVAMRNGVADYVIGRSDRQSGVRCPWMGQTYSNAGIRDGEVCAANVWDRDDGTTTRWAVIERDATADEAVDLAD